MRRTNNRAVLALLDALGLERVTFAGHDWGGYVGFLLALDHPDRIESFLALNVLPPWPASDARTRLDAWRFLYIPVLATRGLGGGRLGRGFAARGLRDAGLAPRTSTPSSAGLRVSAAALPSASIAASCGSFRRSRAADTRRRT